MKITKNHVNGQKGTPYPDLPADHDLSPEELEIRQALQENFHTVEDIARALRVDPAPLKKQSNEDVFI